jgi:hypothetical protein
MEQIYDLLEKLNIDESDLPKEITVHLDKLDTEIEEYNKSVESMEAEGYDVEYIEEALKVECDALEEHEEKILNVINEWYNWKYGEQASAKETKEIEKNGSGFATVAFAALALILTLGAVNLFKK